MDKRIFYLSLITFIILIASTKLAAQNIEQIYMKSGSVVEGYIAEQKPGSFISVQSAKATIIVNSDSLQNKIIERVPIDSLPNEWKQWATENSKWIVKDSKRYLELYTFEFGSCAYSKVFLLEKGSSLKFIDVTPNKYVFNWDEMYRTVKNKRPANLFSGLKEVLVLKDESKIYGQITEQYIGKDVKIETDNGDVLSYKFSQIKQIQTERLNEKMTLWSQIPLLDVIRLKDDSTELVGFISSRTLGKDLVFEFEDGHKRNIQQNQIMSYGKRPNDKYVELYDKFLNDDEILLNGKPAYFTYLHSQGENLLLGEVVSAQLAVGDVVCIEAKFKDPNTHVTLVKAHIENIPKIDGKKNERISWPIITYRDLVQAHVAVSRETTPLGNVKFSFPVNEVGDYVLYVQGRDEYIVINVVEKI